MNCYKDGEKIESFKKKKNHKADVIQNWTIAYSLAMAMGPIVSLSQVGRALL